MSAVVAGLRRGAGPARDGRVLHAAGCVVRALGAQQSHRGSSIGAYS